MTLIQSRLLKLLSLILALTASSYLTAYETERSIGCEKRTEPIWLDYGEFTLRCGFETGTDKDYFSFVGDAGDEIQINVRAERFGLDPVIHLRDGKGRILKAAKCDSQKEGSNRNACSISLKTVLPKSANYSIEISENGRDDSGGYKLVLLRLRPLVQFTELEYGSPVSEQIHPTIDIDFFKFEASAGDEISINLGMERYSFLGKNINSLDPMLTLRNAAGDVIKTGQCSSGRETGEQATCGFAITTKIQKSGTYYLELMEKDLDQSGSYNLIVERLNPPMGARALRFEAPTYDKIDPGVDIDIFKFEAAAQKKVNIRLNTTQFGLDPLLRLKDSKGRMLDSATCDSHIKKGNRTTCRLMITHTPKIGGTFYIEVMDADFNESGGYKLILEKILPEVIPFE